MIRHCIVVFAWLCSLVAVGGQERVPDGVRESGFDTVDTRLFVEELPPRVDPPADWPPRLGQLLPQAPLFTEQRQTLFAVDFDQMSLEANPAQLLFIEPGAVRLVPDDKGGQALLVSTAEPMMAGVTRPLDPTLLAGHVIEISARVRMDQPYEQAPDPRSWYKPLIQMRWERPHPDPERRSEGDTLREWHTIFEGTRGERFPPNFIPDGRFHTYRTRLVAPDDLIGAMLQVVVQQSKATVFFDDIVVSAITTRQERLLAQMAGERDGNLLGRDASFELGVVRAAVTGERRLSPRPGGPVGRDFGIYEAIRSNAAEGRAVLAVQARAGEGAALELPWMGLAAGQPYTMSVWLRADRAGVGAAFGVADAEWRVLGRAVELDTTWRRFAATFTPTRSHQQAYWPWVTVDPPGEDATVYVDGLQVETGSTPGPYRPGRGPLLSIDTGATPAPGLRHLFSEDQPATVTAKLLNQGAEPLTLRLRGMLESHSGRAYRPLAGVPEEVTLPPGQVVELPLNGEPLARGLHRFWLETTDPRDGQVVRAEQIVGVWNRPAVQRFGFHDGPARDSRVAKIAEDARRVGADMIRTAGIPTTDWREHWLGDNTHDWSLFDAYVQGWTSHGVRMLHTLGPDLDTWPEWVLASYGPQFRTPTHGTEPTLPPVKLWSAYVRDVVERYGGRLAAYEVLTAVDQQLTAEEYLPLLQAAAEVIGLAAPEATVVGAGLVDPASTRPGGFLEKLLKAGGADSMDVIATQFSPDYPEALDDARDRLRALADQYDLRLWDVRHSYFEPPLYSHRLNPRGNLVRGLRPFADQPYDGGAFYARHELLMLAAGFERSFVGPSVAEREYLHAPAGAMCEADGAPRSSLAALATIANEIGAAAPLGEWRWDLSVSGPEAPYPYRRDHGVRAVAFQTAPDRCLLAWWTFQRDAAVTVTFEPATTARLALMTGDPVAPPADGRVMLTHAPLYLADLPLAALDRLAELEIGGVRPEVVPPPK